MKDSILQMSLLLMCAVQAAFACESRSLELRKVSPDLTVVVTHRDRPIAGIEVQVVPDKGTEPVLLALPMKTGPFSFGD